MSDVETGEDVCYYFSKTATCRFYERCTKLETFHQLNLKVEFVETEPVILIITGRILVPL